MVKVKVKSTYQLVANQAGAYLWFCNMKWLGVFLLPPGWDASPSQSYPTIEFAGTHFCTWVERGSVRVNRLAQEHNTMYLARARTQTIWCGVECINMRPLCVPVGGAMASWLVRSSPDRAVRVRALAGDTVLCSLARHFTLTVPLSTQVYKWVLVNLMLGDNPVMD